MIVPLMLATSEVVFDVIKLIDVIRQEPNNKSCLNR